MMPMRRTTAVMDKGKPGEDWQGQIESGDGVQVLEQAEGKGNMALQK